MNEHVLTCIRNAAAVRQMLNGTNGDDLYIWNICIATVGKTIQTVNSPMHEYMHEYSGNTVN